VDEQVVRVAESVTVMKKAVSDFEADVRGMRDRVYTAFMEKSGRASDNMARRVCEEFWQADLG